MKSLHFFTGKDGEWRLKVADDGEVVEALGALGALGVSDWLGERLLPDTIAVKRRPMSVTGRRFPRVIDLILDLDPVTPPADLMETKPIFESPPCVHFSEPSTKAVKS